MSTPRPFVCPNQSCGDDKRTVLGTVRSGPLLLLPHGTQVQAIGQTWWIRCPVCERPAPWQGRVAKELRAA